MANYLKLYEEHAATGPDAAAYIFALIKRSKVSIKTFCASAGCSKCTLSRWHNSKTKVGMESFIRFLHAAEGYGVRL